VILARDCIIQSEVGLIGLCVNKHPLLPPLPSVKKLIEIPQNEEATKSSTKAKTLIYTGVMEEAVAWFCRCIGTEKMQKLKQYILDTSSPC